MNKFTFKYLILYLGICMPNYCLSQDLKDAVVYLSQIGEEFQSIQSNTWNYTRAVAHNKSARKIENKRNELIKSVSDAQSKIRKIPPFKGDPSLRDSVQSFLRITYIVLREDYEKILNMEEIAEQSYDLMEAYLLAQEKAEEKLQEAGDRVNKQQNIFAEKNDITLVESNSKTTKNLEAANRMQKYYNTIFLLYFKNFKQELYMVEALNQSDINASEQNRTALIHSVKDSKQLIGPIPGFANDLTLKNACQKALDFYEIEAEKKTPALIDFLIEKENFEKIKKSFEAKSSSQRSKEDIERYNKAIESYNKSLVTFNSINQELNKNRSIMINNWNKVAQDFTSRHTPKR